jgi:hypothetical protein
MAFVKIKKEIVVILYYAIFITAILTVDQFISGGVHGPGFSLLIIMLFVPLSIGYFIMQLATLGNDNHKCIYIHLAIWVALFFLINVF